MTNVGANAHATSYDDDDDDNERCLCAGGMRQTYGALSHRRTHTRARPRTRQCAVCAVRVRRVYLDDYDYIHSHMRAHARKHRQHKLSRTLRHISYCVCLVRPGSL